MIAGVWGEGLGGSGGSQRTLDAYWGGPQVKQGSEDPPRIQRGVRESRGGSGCLGSQPPLTLSYQQRMLSCPHRQLLEEQSSWHVQCWGGDRSRGSGGSPTPPATSPVGGRHTPEGFHTLQRRGVEPQKPPE